MQERDGRSNVAGYSQQLHGTGDTPLTPEDIEYLFIIEFSVGGIQIGKTASKPERRERVRQAIFFNKCEQVQFHDEPTNYAEAFRLCYGERLDRRAAMRALPDDNADPFEDTL